MAFLKYNGLLYASEFLGGMQPSLDFLCELNRLVAEILRALGLNSAKEPFSEFMCI
jgi:hypothetical protein